MEDREFTLAKKLVEYSVRVKQNDRVMIFINGDCGRLPLYVMRAVRERGGTAFIKLNDRRLERELVLGATEEQLKLMAQSESALMREMDCYIGIGGGNNCFELSDVPSELVTRYEKLYSGPVLEERLKKRWVILRYPTQGFAQLTGMSTSAFEDFYFNVCCLDYEKMSNAMNPLVKLMNCTDKVRIVAKDTDLSFSIKGIPTIKCAGECNIPDGEVYTAPVRDSVNGYIHYNMPSIENGFKFEDVRLEFENGRISDVKANDKVRAQKMFDMDEGARYVGEFAIGLNPYVTCATGDILFDEKMSGSIHFTPGCCYDDAPNGNYSALHWDLVLSQIPENGGGEIYFDGKLIRKDGRFVLPELMCLNPENLM